MRLETDNESDEALIDTSLASLQQDQIGYDIALDHNEFMIGWPQFVIHGTSNLPHYASSEWDPTIRTHKVCFQTLKKSDVAISAPVLA